MKIAILYICTGKYNQFFKKFYESSEKYLLPNIQKKYFVWTDDFNLSDANNVKIISRECLGFPEDSLFRFEMFIEEKNELKNFDYIYFFNSNAEIKQKIGVEILPNETGLISAKWPGKRKPLNIPVFFPYERNKKSLAYIKPFQSPYVYYMGGINGGKSKAYLEMIDDLARNIREDYKKGIVARVHDESHINKYFHLHPSKILSEEYCWPEEWEAKFTPKMVFRDKVKVDLYFDKSRNHSLKDKIKKGFIILRNAICWYL